MFNKPNLFPKNPEPATRSPLQRPGVPASGASAGTEAAAPARDLQAGMRDSTPAASAEPVKDSTASVGSSLIVGPDVKLKGAEILDCDTLVVEGRVEATMDSRVIRIAQNGAYEGTVGIDVAEIHGRFDGELTARQQLIIHATGRVSGKIRYGKIFIEEGGEISGDVQSLSKTGSRETLRAVDSRSTETRPLAAAS